ncbi:MAG TPA: pitrilysin family protein, partial [Thermoanaerobaculia bacterium]|nr:pitrilysin family protein [Thermoanaerobaculia bacterium]
AMLLRGTTTRSRQQIQDELDRLRATLRIGGGGEGARATLEVPRQNLEAALRLLADALQHPAFDEKELALLAEEQVRSLEDVRRDPFEQAFTALQRHMDDYPLADPRHVETVDEAIAAVRATKVADLRSFHTDFYGASAAQLAVVGDFDPAAVEALAGELFGGWKSAKAFTRVSRPVREGAPLAVALEIPDKESAVFAAGQSLRLKDDDPDYPALVLANFMTGGGFLNSRLAVRLRQKDGVSYGVGSQLSASPFEPRGDFLAFAIFAPQNADKAETGLREELAKVVDGGFTAEEIAAAKSGWLQQRKVSRSQEAQLASVLAQRQYAGRTLAWDEDLERRVEALTPEQIAAAVKRFWSTGQLSFVKAGSFAKPVEAAPAGAAKSGS